MCVYMYVLNEHIRYKFSSFWCSRRRVGFVWVSSSWCIHVVVIITLTHSEAWTFRIREFMYDFNLCDLSLKILKTNHQKTNFFEYLIMEKNFGWRRHSSSIDMHIETYTYMHISIGNEIERISYSNFYSTDLSADGQNSHRKCEMKPSKLTENCGNSRYKKSIAVAMRTPPHQT